MSVTSEIILLAVVSGLLVLAWWLAIIPPEKYYRIEQKAGQLALPIGIVFLALGLILKGHH